jgi:hypothetical protein
MAPDDTQSSEVELDVQVLRAEFAIGARWFNGG